MRPSRVLAGAVAALCVALGLTTAPAQAASGPAYSVPAGDLAASLHCVGDPTKGPAPVLLVPGTTQSPEANFDWNYEPAFTAQGRAWCAVRLPAFGMGDIAVAAEYVTNGIRTLHAKAGRKVSVVGFSQGGMVPRWSLKYFPDTRAMVDDMVGIDPSNHGTLDAYAVCAVGGCAPAFWQQQTGSRFLKALNAEQETYAGISYTQMYTATDEIVVPNLGPAPSSALTTGAGARSNTLVQSICPVHVADHLTMGTSDAVGYALVQDALGHAGPAQASRVPRSVCAQPFLPGVTAVSFARNFPRVAGLAVDQVLTAKHVPAEPELPAYAR
ncbi:lipase [Marmoricola endophyticus]|uniref:Lipase n=1 Tax=Marmoricola endophyticus TaxID=2040280 RepID=A0A917BHC7_9ACTN|nr:lipase [Marmoricola endophyticus]GGF45672.1 lipase [Marmoricola endophyticus]